MASDTRLDSEAAEAEVRRLMAKHAAIAPRGWTSVAQRAQIRRQIDAALDARSGALLAEYAEREMA